MTPRPLSRLLAWLTCFGRTVLAGIRFKHQLRQGRFSSCTRFMADRFEPREGP
jgi:hypothetical protein